jgi:hypothetical protein
MLKVHENISVDYYKEIPEYKPNQMDKAVYTIITILFYSDSASLMKIHDENVENCVIFTEDYRLLYQTHFFLVKLLRVQVLQSKGDTLALNQFTQDALRVMSNFFVAFEIAETFSTKNAKARMHRFHDVRIKQGVVADCEPIDYEEFFKIKTLTSGSVEGYVIIAWHPSVLHQFLDQDNQTVLPKIRATYALQFIFSEKHLCKTIKTEMDNILRRLWIEFNVVNVIAQAPCSCDTSEIYIYRPFVKTDNLWGLTEYYHLQDVTSKFRVITNPLTDLNGCSLKISIFERFPSAVKNLPRMFLHNPIYKNLTWSKGFGSVDGILLGVLAEHLKFDVVPVAGKSKNNQGIAFPNGTTTGSLHDVAYRKVVYGATSRAVQNYSTLIEFATPILTNQLCIVVPKALKLSNWAILINSFDQASWIFIILSIIASAIFWYQVGPSTDFTEQTWQILSFLLGIPTKLVPVLHQLAFLMGCMIFNIVILGILQGFLFTSFTKTLYHKDVNTLEEVVQLGLPIASDRWNLIGTDSDIMKRLKIIQADPNDKILDRVAYQRNLVAFQSKLSFTLASRSKYVDEDGQPLLHIVDECVGSYAVATILPKGSAFLKIFNHIIIKLSEGGFPWKWLYDYFDSIIAEKMIRRSKKHHTRVNSFSLHDIESGFHILILGNICAVLVFVGEIMWKRINK